MVPTLNVSDTNEPQQTPLRGNVRVVNNLHPAQAQGFRRVGQPRENLHHLLEVVHLIEISLHKQVLQVEMLLAGLQESRNVTQVVVLGCGMVSNK